MLPNALQAEIPVEKIRDYLLSNSHPTGKFKATFFRSLGFTLENHAELTREFRRLVNSADANLADSNDYGQKYVVRGMIRGPNGKEAEIESVWIVLNSTSHPRFITAYPGA